MFFREYSPTIIENTKKYELKCPNCSNITNHQIYEFYTGFCIGVIFSNKPLISKKKYYLVCPICSNLSKELTLEEVNNSYGEGIIKSENNKSYCPNCGRKVGHKQSFCKYCGARL